MKQTFFSTVFQLCTGFRLYRELRDRPVISSLFYLVKLTVILVVIVMAAYYPRVLDLRDTAARWADQHLPAMSIADGKLTTTAPQPFRTGNASFLLLLDTTGSKLPPPDPKSEKGLSLGADSLMFWQKLGTAADAPIQSRSYPLRGFPDGTVNGAYLTNFFNAFLWVGLPVGFVLLTVTGTLVSLLHAFLFSFLTSILDRGAPGAMPFPQKLNVAIHAVTPPAIIVAAYVAMGLQGMDFWLVYLMAYGATLLGANYACRNPVPAETTSHDDFL